MKNYVNQQWRRKNYMFAHFLVTDNADLFEERDIETMEKRVAKVKRKGMYKDHVPICFKDFHPTCTHTEIPSEVIRSKKVKRYG